jgi:hypothetical protein
MPTLELWYVNLVTKNLNDQVYIDLINDMRTMGNGIFNATFKINDSFICDYIVTELDTYAQPGPTKPSQIPGR